MRREGLGMTYWYLVSTENLCFSVFESVRVLNAADGLVRVLPTLLHTIPWHAYRCTIWRCSWESSNREKGLGKEKSKGGNGRRLVRNTIGWRIYLT